MPSSAWAGCICFDSEVEVEAEKGVLYRRPILRAAQLSYEVYCSCAGEGLRCNVLYRRHPLNFQYPVRAEPLVFLTSLWVQHPAITSSKQTEWTYCSKYIDPARGVDTWHPTAWRTLNGQPYYSTINIFFLSLDLPSARHFFLYPRIGVFCPINFKISTWAEFSPICVKFLPVKSTVHIQHCQQKFKLFNSFLLYTVDVNQVM